MTMALARTNFILAVLLSLGLGHIVFFEPQMTTTSEAKKLERRVLDIVANDIERIKIKRDHWTSALIHRTGPTGFRVVEPVASAADNKLVMRLLSVLEFLENKSTISLKRSDAAPLSDYGLSSPVLEISLESADESQIHIAIGTSSGMKDGIYMMVFGENQINVVSNELQKLAERLLDVSIKPSSSSLTGDYSE